MRGEVPSGWVGARASDVFLLAYGKSLPADARTGDGFPVLGSAGNVGLHRDPLVRGPGVVVGRKGTAGAVHWVEGDFTPIDTTYFVERRTDNDWRWLYFALTAANLPALCETTGVPGLNRERVAAMQMLVPPFPEQKKIAAILSSVDEAIQATQAVIDQTRRVKEGLLQDLLTRGIGHTRFKQTEIGEIPEGWEVSCLSDLSHRITKGTTPTTYGHAYTDHGVHFLRVENITDDGRIDLSETKYVSEETHRTFERSMLAGGELLISIAGAIGRAAVVRADAVPANVNQALAVLRLRDELVDEHYVLHAVMSKTVRDQIERLRAGLAQFNLNLKQVGELKIAVPPRDEQVLLSQKLDVSARLLEIHEGHFVSLRTLKSGLLTDLLTGKVRVAP